jgi:hypothetical protein
VANIVIMVSPFSLAFYVYSLLKLGHSIQRLSEVRLLLTSLNNLNAIFDDMIRGRTIDSFNELKIVSRFEAAADDEDFPPNLRTRAAEILACIAGPYTRRRECTQQEGQSP